MQNNITIQNVETHMEKYIGAPSGHFQGFVQWAWDIRMSTMVMIRESEMEVHPVLLADLVYSMQQDRDFQNATKQELEGVATEYIQHHRLELVESLYQSVKEYQRYN